MPSTPDLKRYLREMEHLAKVYQDGVEALQIHAGGAAPLQEMQHVLTQAAARASEAVADLRERGAERFFPFRLVFRLLDSMARFGPFVLMSCLTFAVLYGLVQFFLWTRDFGPALRVPLYILAWLVYPAAVMATMFGLPVQTNRRRWVVVLVSAVLLGLGLVSIVFPALLLAIAISGWMASSTRPARSRVDMLANAASIQGVLGLGYRSALLMEQAPSETRLALSPATRAFVQLSLSGIEEALDLQKMAAESSLAPGETNVSEAASRVDAAHDALSRAQEAHDSAPLRPGEYLEPFDPRPYQAEIERHTRALRAAEERQYEQRNRELGKLTELRSGRFPKYRHAALTNASISLMGTEAGTPIDPMKVSPLQVPGFDDQEPAAPFSVERPAEDRFYEPGPWRVVGALVLGATAISISGGHPMWVLIAAGVGLLVGPWLRFFSGISFYVLGLAADLYDRRWVRLILPAMLGVGVYFLGAFLTRLGP
jgi:hypothetical protein